MSVHKNARTTPHGRAVMVRRIEKEGWTAVAVAAAFGISERTVRKWLARYRAEGLAGLQDRSSRARTVANRLGEAWVGMVLRLRRDCTGFLVRALRWFRERGVRVERVMSDNGSGYVSRLFAKACRLLHSATCGPGPTRRRPTARPNASSRHSCANGPTPCPTAPPTAAPPTCPDGSPGTIPTGRTLASPAVPPLPCSLQPPEQPARKPQLGRPSQGLHAPPPSARAHRAWHLLDFFDVDIAGLKLLLFVRAAARPSGSPPASTSGTMLHMR